MLFLYDEGLDTPFHIDALRKMLRIAREVRIFPITAMDGSPSPHLDPACTAMEAAGHTTAIERVDYEFLKNANAMLKITAHAT